MIRVLAPAAASFATLAVLTATAMFSSTAVRAEGMAISASSAGSSASSAGSASLRGSSDSIRASSGSSSDNDEPVRQGEYRVREVAPLAGKPDMLTVRLEPLDAGTQQGGFFLDLPRRALDGRPLAQGDVITANPQNYGVEFARGTPRAPFFLVVAQAVERELATRPVKATSLN